MREKNKIPCQSPEKGWCGWRAGGVVWCGVVACRVLVYALSEFETTTKNNEPAEVIRYVLSLCAKKEEKFGLFAFRQKGSRAFFFNL